MSKLTDTVLYLSIMDIIEFLNTRSLRLRCFLLCKLYNITIPFHSNINNMFRDEIIQYWMDNCNLLDSYYFQSKYVTWEIVQANPDKNWDYHWLSANPNITWEIVQDNPDKGWNDYCLSLNPNITWGIIQANPNKDWHYSLLSSNHNITWEIVQDNPDKAWSYYGLSSNPNITWEIMQANQCDDPGRKWRYGRLSSNPNITWGIVQDNPNHNWNYIAVILRLLYT
jgi:hypothetical protein